MWLVGNYIQGSILENRALKESIYENFYDVKKKNPYNALARHSTEFMNHHFKFLILDLVHADWTMEIKYGTIQIEIATNYCS